MKLFARTQQWLSSLLASPHSNRAARRRRAHSQIGQALEPRVVLAAPTLGAISNVTVLAGSPLLIALNGADADNQSLTFSATSSNVALTTQIPTGNHSLKMDVQNFGTMTFQLFEDRVPRVTNHIISLANSDFYNGSIFHRVINNFVIQGGDSNGNPPGTGGSNLGDFDDQFDVDLQHNQTGILSMAKTTDDTNDSQFFVTEGAQRHLDFQHSIFGFLTTGESVRQAISNVAVNSSSRPTTDVVLTDVSVITDTQNGVLMLKAPEGTTGTSAITVTVRDPNGNTSEQTFTVTIAADTTNSNPFLKDLPKLRTLVDTPFQFVLQGVDVENQQIGYIGQAALQQQSLFIPQLANANLAYTVGITSGVVDVSPSNGLLGEQGFTVASGTSYSALDYQVAKLNIASAASPLVVSGADHPTVNQSNDGKADTFLVKTRGNNVQVYINGALSYEALKSSVTTLTINGSNDNDSFIFDNTDGSVLLTGGVIVNGSAGSDDVTIIGGATVATNVIDNLSNGAAGSISVDGKVLSFTSTEAAFDNVASTNRSVQYGSASSAISLTDDATAGDGISKLAGPGLVTLKFKAPSNALLINAGAGDDTLNASGGDSLLTVGLQLLGSGGNDSIIGSSRDDTLSGGGGNDVLQAGNGTDTLTETADANFTLGVSTMTGLGADSISAFERATITGGEGNNIINAAAFGGSVTVNGLGGADTIIGSAFADSINGGSGSDSIDAGNGNDTVQAGLNSDTVIGGAGDDLLSGGDGFDLLAESGDVNFTLSTTTLTGQGTDTFDSFERASLTGGNSANTIDTTAFTASVVINAGGGADTVTTGIGPDSINGGAGDDSIVSGGGNDTVQGGADNDTLNGGDGTDLLSETADVNFTVGAATLVGFGNDSFSLIERVSLTTGDSANMIDASAFPGGVDISSGGGADTIIGSAVGDSINTGSGADLITGGSGDDTIQGGPDDDTLIGGIGSDALSGGTGNDRVDGGGGSDALTGGAGRDTLIGGTGTDALIEVDDALSVVVTNTTLSGYSASGNDSLGGIESVQLILGAGASLIDAQALTIPLVVFAGAGNDTVIGGSGNDTISGQDGNDSLRGGGGNDALDGNEGDDTLIGDSGDDSIVGSNGNDGLSGSIGNDTVIGGAGVDTLFGLAGNDTLDGYADGDIVFGGDGNDTVLGGDGADTLVGGNGGNGAVDNPLDNFGAEISERIETFALPSMPAWAV